MSIGTQPESDIPIPLSDITEDPRNRYGSRPIPQNYQQQTSSYYLPITRDNRFFPIFYDLHRANDCWKYINVGLLNSQQYKCESDTDCSEKIDNYCTKGALNFIKSTCIKINPTNLNNKNDKEHFNYSRFDNNNNNHFIRITSPESLHYLSNLNQSVKSENPLQFKNDHYQNQRLKTHNQNQNQHQNKQNRQRHNYCHYQSNGSNIL